MDIIGLNGRKSSGKDTVGAYLVEQYGFKRVSFAALLKQSAAALFDIPIEFWEETKNDPATKVRIVRSKEAAPEDTPLGIAGTLHEQITDLSAREFLQRYGTEAHRDVFGSGFWVDALFAQIYETDGPFVVTDTRFLNELREVRRWGGINIRILREPLGKEDTHVSEVDPDMSLIDAMIDNNGTFEELHLSVDAIIQDVWAQRPHGRVQAPR